MSDYGDAVAAALHADAEAAREEIRAAGIMCPSCRTNLADLYGKGHQYVTGTAHLPFTVGGIVRCSDGAEVSWEDLTYEQANAAINIALMDEFWRAEDEAMTRHVLGFKGDPPAGTFKGLIGMLP